MIVKICLALALFVVGELLSNLVLFRYLKSRFSNEDDNSAKTSSAILGIPLPIFKGILERLVLFTALHFAFTPILVVFGTLKLGTRLNPNSEQKQVSNDYFLVGNFTSILIAMLYTFAYSQFSVLLSNLVATANIFEKKAAPITKSLDKDQVQLC